MTQPSNPAETRTDPDLSTQAATTLASVRKAAEARLDAALRAGGVSNPADVTDEHGWRTIVLNSVRGSIAIVEADETVFLRVIVPVMELPSDQELILPLMRELLERNFNVRGRPVSPSTDMWWWSP